MQLPGIYDLQAVDAFKVFGVAGDELEVGSEGDSGNLGVWYVNRSTSQLSLHLHQGIVLNSTPAEVDASPKKSSLKI